MAQLLSDMSVSRAMMSFTVRVAPAMRDQKLYSM